MVRQPKTGRQVSPLRRAKWRLRWFHRKKLMHKLLIISIPFFVFLITVPILTYVYFARDISDRDRLMNRNNTGVVLLATGGEEIYRSGKAKHQDPIPLAQISDKAEHALIAAEDKNFYEHSGFSIGSMLGALYVNFVSGGNGYGGSTLTQQLAKNTLLSADKNYLRKFQELSIAIAIERTYSKDEILEMYLNSVFFGENAFGIEDAAQTYFGKKSADLDLAESAMLIGLLPAPSIYSPISGNPEYAKERQTTVLTRMVTNQYISEAEKQAALAQPLTYRPAKSFADTSPAPHFAQMVLDQLYDKYGIEQVTRSGYQVQTTLDLNLQKQMQSNISNHMPYIQRNGGSNAGGIAIDPTTGEIRALVGSADWNNEEFGKVNMATTPRQPGSSFKPIYYSDALASGVITPATIFRDEPINIDGYSPQNANRTFSGDISVRNALSRSLNIPSVKVMQKMGVSTAIDAAKRMGISTINQGSSEYGLALALGTAEVPLVEMTNAYAAFAVGGQQFDAISIKEIESKYNEKIFTARQKSARVISPEGAFLISSILSDNAARAPIFGGSLTVAGKTTAVKTGTTDDSRDAWTIGYTPQIAIGVWVGNNDNTVMRNGGSGMAGPIWVATMRNALASTPNTPFSPPTGIVQRLVCSDGSLSDTVIEGKTHNEYFLSTALPTTRCLEKPVEPKPVEKPKEEEQEEDTEEEVDVTSTKTTLSVSPNNSAQFGSTVTLTAEVSQSAKGTVVFMDGQNTIGTIAVVNGEAEMTTNFLAVGNHSLTAVFKPANPEEFETSTSKPVQYTITAGQGNNNNNGGLFR